MEPALPGQLGRIGDQHVAPGRATVGQGRSPARFYAPSAVARPGALGDSARVVGLGLGLHRDMIDHGAAVSSASRASLISPETVVPLSRAASAARA